MLDEMRPAALARPPRGASRRRCGCGSRPGRPEARCGGPHSRGRWAGCRTARPDRGRCRCRDRASRDRRSGPRPGRRARRRRARRRVGTGRVRRVHAFGRRPMCWPVRSALSSRSCTSFPCRGLTPDEWKRNIKRTYESESHAANVPPGRAPRRLARGGARDRKRRPRRRPRACLPFGLEAVDGRLAGGGLAIAALHEAAPATPALGDDAAATLFFAAVAARLAPAQGEGTVLWALAPPRSVRARPRSGRAGARAADLCRMPRDEEVLAVMEEGLRHGGLAAVVGEVGARRAWPPPAASSSPPRKAGPPL